MSKWDPIRDGKQKNKVLGTIPILGKSKKPKKSRLEDGKPKATEANDDNVYYEPMNPKEPLLPDDNAPPVEVPDISSESDDVDVEQKKLIAELNTNILFNASAHNTNKFDMVKKTKPEMVVRRGQLFEVTLTFTIVPSTELLNTVSFLTIKKGVEGPRKVSGAYNEFILQPTDKDLTNKAWSAHIISKNDKQIRIGIMSPFNCYVGSWKLRVGVRADDTLNYFEKVLPFYILFNPWSKDDQVYMENSDERQEYVLEDQVIMYDGVCESFSNIPWDLKLSGAKILKIAFYIISKFKKMDVTKTGDAIQVCRTLASLGSHLKTPSLLIGRWDNQYQGGKDPKLWMDSKDILDTFWRTKESVKYGTNRTFAVVVATIARAIGIPCRIVTGFSIGSDTDGSITINDVIDQNGKTVGSLSNDTLWGVHTWNECWMKRDDLENRFYSGWQVVDATPQIISDNGEYCIGPFPVKAVLEGDIDAPYDGKFVFSSVHGDSVTWRYDGKDKPLIILDYNTDAVGICILTKGIGKSKYQDLKLNYKPKDINDQRIVARNAMGHVTNVLNTQYLNEKAKSLKLTIEVSPKPVEMGKSFTVKGYYEMKNFDQTLSGKTMWVQMRIVFVYNLKKYTFPLRRFTGKVNFKKGKNIMFDETVEYTSYNSIADQEGKFVISSLAAIRGYPERIEGFEKVDCNIKYPDLTMKIVGTSVVEGVYFETIEASFKNPLPFAITGYYEVTGPELYAKQEIPSIKSGELSKYSFLVKRPIDKATIFALFQSKSLRAIRGAIFWTGDSWSN